MSHREWQPGSWHQKHNASRWVDDLSWAYPTCLLPQLAPNPVSQGRGHLLLSSRPRAFLVLSYLLFHSKSLLSLGDRGGKAGVCALQLPTNLPPLTLSILLERELFPICFPTSVSLGQTFYNAHPEAGSRTLVPGVVSRFFSPAPHSPVNSARFKIRRLGRTQRWHPREHHIPLKVWILQAPSPVITHSMAVLISKLAKASFFWREGHHHSNKLTL